MFKSSIYILMIVSVVNADLTEKKKPFTFGPYAVCCDMPVLGYSKSECFDLEPIDEDSVCSEIQCAFEDLGFLTNKNMVNKETYKNYLLEWAEKHKDWSAGVNKTIADCINKDLGKSMKPGCNAYDMYACTGISMILTCPKEAQKC